MANSGVYVSTKLESLHPGFTNEYLLKHGNIFMKPNVLSNGYSYPLFPGDVAYRSAKNGISSVPLVTPNYDAPLDFVIKHEKPPTPPASTSPVNTKTPPLSLTPDEKTVCQLPVDQSKSTTWILGKQKLSWDNSTVASYNPETKMFRCVVCNAVGFLSRIAEHYLGTHTSAKVFQCLHCPYSSTWSRCVRMHMAKHHGVPNAPPSLWKGQPLLEEIFLLLTNLKTTVDSQGRDRADPELSDKKFVCPKCPYTTDRRDLFLRHENIHKEDKPYHCYICFKLFNRADHVKKHFLRIHRGHPYDISLVRRRPPRNSSSYSCKTSSVISNLSPKVNAENKSKGGNPMNGTLNGIPKENSNVFPWNNCINTANIQKAKGFECPVCAWEGADSWCLRRHMNVHTKNYGCPSCEFKTGKAEKLFTHVYKTHKMLICTKCKYVTDQAFKFDCHIKDCCAEIVLAPPKGKQNSDDSPNDSDNSISSVLKHEHDAVERISSELRFPPTTKTNTQSTEGPERCPTNTSDLKASVSIIPLHNSISYCYPSQATSQFTSVKSNGIANIASGILSGIHSEELKPSKNDLKTGLCSPVQSSSDSSFADITNNKDDLDLSCWQCGCEFANESSLLIHTELYHRSPKDSNNSTDSESPQKLDKKRYSCTLCNFKSKEQTTILDHMRFHTGETLVCRAGNPCTFSTIFDTTLREHVQNVHADGNKRCPHCGLHCLDRNTFIRHYRKFHHSTSCYRCQSLRRSYNSRNTTDSSTVVQPYLHHNPYAKSNSSSNGTIPYTHCDSAMSKVAVSIPPSVIDESIQTTSCNNINSQGERRSRKQTAPKKMVHDSILPENRLSPADDSKIQNCDIDLRRSGINKCIQKDSIKICMSEQHTQFWYCRICYKKPVCYRNRVNFLVHSLWCHHSKKFKCRICGKGFRHRHQRLLHKRKQHEASYNKM